MTLTDNDTPKSSWLQIKNQNIAKSILSSNNKPPLHLQISNIEHQNKNNILAAFLHSFAWSYSYPSWMFRCRNVYQVPDLSQDHTRATGLRATSSPFSSIEVPFLPQSVRFAYSLFFSSNPLQHFHLSVQPVHHFLHFHFFLIMFHLQNSVSSTKPIFIFHTSIAMLFVLVWCGLSSLFVHCLFWSEVTVRFLPWVCMTLFCKHNYSY